jgi:hypothetical protein
MWSIWLLRAVAVQMLVAVQVALEVVELVDYWQDSLVLLSDHLLQ